MACEYINWNNHPLSEGLKSFIITVTSRSNERSSNVQECEIPKEKCPITKVLELVNKKPSPETGITGENIEYPECPIVAVNVRRIA
jgi:hypothetical protein